MATVIVEPEKVFSTTEMRRLERWIRIFESPLSLLLDVSAKGVFREFDQEYFRRTGVSEQQYLEALISEAKQVASLRFTGMPDGASVTAFHFPEAERPNAYKEFEASFLARCAAEEDRLQFKAYVARRLGLRVPLRKHGKAT